VLPAASRVAQPYPTRPVRLIVGFAAGGGSDIVARVISQQLSTRLGQQLVVENRTGAANNIATETVVDAPPDGYTLLVATTGNAINATLYDRLNFDTKRPRNTTFAPCFKNRYCPSLMRGSSLTQGRLPVRQSG
jgi:tripartite-type tricarboxylate transporter receptor subunit TctC